MTSEVSNSLRKRPPLSCVLCPAVALRVVGNRGYCKKHYPEACADRTRINSLVDEGKIKPQDSVIVQKMLSDMISRPRGKK